MSEVVITKDGNALRLKFSDQDLARPVMAALTYEKRTFLATKQQKMQHGGKDVLTESIDCYRWITPPESKPHLLTNAGYLNRIQSTLYNRGIKFVIRDKTPANKRVKLIPFWDMVEEAYTFRPGQREALQAILANERCFINWATGVGKTALLDMICKLLPKNRIVVTTKYGDTLDSIYRRLQGNVSGVGIYWSGKKSHAARVLCCSSGCLKYALDTFKPDIVIADEVHELATDQPIAELAKFRYARMIALSANHNDRMDGADFELEGLFGNVVSVKTYQDGVDDGSIVPLQVHWRHVDSRKNPAAGKTGFLRKKLGIWRNQFRNEMIAEDARRFGDDEQVLITVSTLEHALALKKLLPEYTLVYRPKTTEERDSFISCGLMDAKEPVMTKQRRDTLRRQFEKGTLKKVIVTTVWNRGVDFRSLAVLIRADGEASKINSTQIPGRTSRTASGKEYSVMIDYDDAFDFALERKAIGRRATYRKHKWQQFVEEDEGHLTKWELV